LASRGLHVHVACRSYVSLIREVERCELRNAVADRQSRCHREIWASRSAGAHILDKTTNVRSIVESRRGAGGSRCITRRRRRCGRRRGLLWPRTQRPRDRIHLARKSVSSVPTSGFSELASLYLVEIGEPIPNRIGCRSEAGYSGPPSPCACRSLRPGLPRRIGTGERAAGVRRGPRRAALRPRRPLRFRGRSSRRTGATAPPSAPRRPRAREKLSRPEA